MLGESLDVPEASEYGFARKSGYPLAGERQAKAALAVFCSERIAEYDRTRNVPALDATSHVSPHLRAGTLGIRRCVWRAMEAREANRERPAGVDTWLSELIWRDFYDAILAHVPRVAVEPFLEKARRVPWRESEDDFRAWCEGRTGYPFVDAGMRQLEATGWMHNRLRMVVASFLTKDLLIDYRRGERYFERALADADLASNNGGWQWAASTGTDAAPYFRVFNPVTQSTTFDPTGAFIRRWVPELRSLDERSIHAPWRAAPLVLQSANVTLGQTYPFPIVEHGEARVRAIAAYKASFGDSVKT